MIAEKPNLNHAAAEETLGAVMVVGAGITGMQSALDLAESGFKVYLVDSAPAIGGRMAQLDKTFPTGDCAMCILSPKLVACARNKNIDIITMADVQKIEGAAGNFSVSVVRRPRYVDPRKCNACGDCAEVCPVNLPNEFDRKLGTRKAVFRLYPQAIPNLFGISKAAGPAPCRSACPAGVNVQGYVALIAAGKFKEAYELVRQRCPLPAACGRVCQHPCETDCNRKDVDHSVAVRDLKRFAADYVYAHPEELKDDPPPPVEPQKEKVAVIGGGPAGLTAAVDLRKMGYAVTIFEATPLLGGMLRYGIPRYRLSAEVLDQEIKHITDLGIEARTGSRVENLETLLKSAAHSNNGGATGKFDAVFAAIGAWTSRRLGIPGEDAPQVWPGLKFLHEVNVGGKPAIGPNVLVIGGGDVAMDAARCAKRLSGVKTVRLVSLEKRVEMPAHSWEAAEALEEGIEFHNGWGPTEVLAAGGTITGMAFRACTRVFDENRRFAPQFDDSRKTTLTADTIIVTIGQGIDNTALGKLATGPGGRIVVDKESLATGIPGIFAGGDAVLGPASMVDAMAQGHRAAEAIHAYLRGNPAKKAGAAADAKKEAAPNPKPDAPQVERQPMPQAAATERIANFHEIDLGYSAEQAVAEAKRCLACGMCSECGLCVTACSAGAISHDMQPVTEVLRVGSVILTPGYDEFQAAQRGEFGHGRYANVVSSVQFERLLSAAGPTGGQVLRPSDGKHAKRIAFIQCVGSRDPARGNPYCSSICCMSATKEAMVALEHEAGLSVSIFCMDIRAFGKEFDAYVNRARDENGVKFIRAIPSRIVEMPGSRNPRVRYFDEEGRRQDEEFDIVVLSVGLRPSSSVKDLATRLGIDLNDAGFCRTDRLAPLAASRPGLYVAGAIQEPKDIPESVAQASGAAACAMEQLASARGTMIQRREYPWERDVTDEAPRIGVFICHCGHNIASVIDVQAVARHALKLPFVAHAEAALYTCSDNNLQHIKVVILQKRLNRVVVASCSPRTHEALFQETLRESGLNPYLFAMTNIRDQCSWVHRDDPVAATEKAHDLMAMAVARARHLRPLETGILAVTNSALVIGGGLAGMTAALAIADQGFQVHLIEKEAELGGNLRHIHMTLERADVAAFLADLTRRVQSHPKITVYLRTTAAQVAGHVGNFKSRLLKKTDDGQSPDINVAHGVTIIAAGGVERPTEKYLYGRHPRVITQRQLEQVLAAGRESAVPNSQFPIPNSPTVVMIQCVESRNAKNPYCSRVCCSEAIKNALTLRAKYPSATVIVLAKDIRTYGFRELAYQEAREKGILFIRHPETQDPAVTDDAGKLTVRVTDAGTQREVVLHPDLLALSVGIAPAADNPALSSMLRTALTSDGFFLEAHPKLRPVDLANEGEFICGLSHSPRFIDETIAQAKAVAGRAATVLSKSFLTIAGQVARVNADNCVACATCVKVCPFGAPLINDLKKAEIQGAKCMGCGSCAASCPAHTITLQHQEDLQVSAMLDELLLASGGAP
jgi:heterodisulfide reductase subunit A-like polyferredoxin